MVLVNRTTTAEDSGDKNQNPQPHVTPTQYTPVEWPADIDQYESPYSYENEQEDSDAKSD